MFKHFWPSCALFLIAGGLHLSAQSSILDSAYSGQNGQPSTAGCTDSMLAAGIPCTPNQQQLPRNANPGSNLPDNNGLRNVPNLGPVLPEGTATSTDSMNGRARLQAQLLPPDPPTEFQRFVAETTGQYLQIYGEELFRRVPSTFAPSDQTPVPQDYVIGPGDELQVRIWGQVDFSGNLRVDRSGNVYLPKVGNIPVAGLKFSTLDQHLRAAVARLYRNFDLSVDIGRIRAIQIYVSGRARRPGAYTVSSLSSLVDALFTTGGPAPQGSMRHIFLHREGKTVADFDLYGLLLHGDKSTDVRLLPEDVLYIAPSGPQVAITGSIQNPGIYELRPGDTIGSLIDMAGGTSVVASHSRISVERVHQHQNQKTLTIDFNDAGLATALEDGDILRVAPIVPEFDNTVTLRGNVANPGRFTWHPGMRLSDVIPDVNSLVSRDYWWKRSHLGLPSPEFEPSVSALGQAAPQLGDIHQPKNGETILAGPSGRPVPENPNDPAGREQGLDHWDSLDSDTETNTQHSTNAGIASAGSGRLPNNSVEPGERNRIPLPDHQIAWSYAVIERIDPQSLHPTLIPFDLGKLVLDHDAAANLELQPHDTVTIFSQSDIRVPLDRQTKYIELGGEVVHPGFYSVQPDETLRDVVERAGGLTSKAYLFGSAFTRESTRILQQQRLDDYLQGLSLDAERGTQALAAASTSSAGAQADVTASRIATQNLVSRLSQIKATGRIVLQFPPNQSKIEDIPRISLENGDKFIVPFVPANVNVVGAVYDQNSYVFVPRKPLEYYLRLAGGTNRNADWHHAFVIRADGSVVSRDHMQGSGFWKDSFTALRINPGDTVVVPDKTVRPTALRAFLEWSQLFSQLALGAAAIHAL